MIQNAPRKDRLISLAIPVLALLLVSPALAQPRLAVTGKAPLPLARPASQPRPPQATRQTDEPQDPEAEEADTNSEAPPTVQAEPPRSEPRGLFQALFGATPSPPPPAEPPVTALQPAAEAAALAAPLPVPRSISGAPASAMTFASAAPAGVLSNLNGAPPPLASEEEQMDEEEQVEAMDPAPAPQGITPPQSSGTGTMTFPVPGPGGGPPPSLGRGQAYAALPPANADWPRFVPGALPRESLPGFGGDKVVADPIAPLACLPSVVKRALSDVALKFGPIIVRSTHRPPDMNRRMGGARASMHIACRAADFRIEAEAGPVLAYLRAKPELGGVKRYRNGIIHIDDGDRRSW